MQNFDWQLLKSEHIVRDRWISLRADTCRMPNGRIIAPYYVYEYHKDLILNSLINFMLR